MKKLKQFMPLVIFIIVIGVTAWGFIGVMKFPNKTIVRVMFWIIFGITFIFSVLSYKKLYNKRKEIEEGIEFLKNIDSSQIHNKFSEIDKFFKEKDELKRTWKQYEDTIRRIKYLNAGERRNKYFTTIEADYFFDESFITCDFNTKLYNYIPQLLIALGIFGTFLGLVLGLEGLNIGNTAETQNSIKILISGVNLSFLTSLYGIAYSIIFTFFQKYLIGNSVTKVDRLSIKLDTLFPKNTQEDGVKELYNELEKQTGAMESMATDFAEIVDEKFNDTLQKNLSPTLKKLGKSAERLANISANTNQNAIEKLVENAGEVISNATQDEMSKLADSLDKITAENEAMFNRFSASITKIEKMIDNQEHVIQQTNNSAQNVEKTNENIKDMAAELNNSIDKLVNFSQAQESTINNYSQMLNEAKTYIKQQNESNKLLAATLEDSYQISEKQQELNRDLGQTTDNLNELMQQLDPILNKLGSNISQFEEMTKEIDNKFITSLQELDEYYSNINNSLDSITNQFNIVAKEFKGNIIEKLNTINNNYDTISNRLNSFSQESTEIIEEFKRFAETQKSSQKLWSSYKDSFDDLNQEIEEGIKEYTTNVRSGVGSILGEYDSHIESVLENFNATIDQFTDTIDELNDVLYFLEEVSKERHE